MMNPRETILAVLRYEHYDEMPAVCFGYWGETLEKWAIEGHISKDEVEGYIKYGDNSDADKAIMKKLGFDFNWSSCAAIEIGLWPAFERKLIEQKKDGSQIIRDESGLIVRVKPDVVSIPSEIGTSLTDRKAWEQLYLPKLQFSKDRIPAGQMKNLVDDTKREIPIGIFCGSLIGTIRNLLGVEQLSYLYVDDEELFTEIIDTFGDLSYNCVKAALETGAKFDFAHYWEDICFKNGPLVVPSVFESFIGPHYKKTTALLKSHGVDIVSVDCDGLIDSLIPTWLNNGVNTMFPIEVGTWNASIKPWREKYGRQIRGVGGMNKNVFSMDYKAVNGEIERLKELIDLGGFIPCPDHRIAPDAKFENVQYYCEQLKSIT